MVPPGRRAIVTRSLGWGWLSIWALVWLGLLAPGQDWGSERARWWATLVPWVTLPVGWFVGCVVREASQRGTATHRSSLRWVLQPVAVSTCLALLGLLGSGQREAIAIVVAAFAAYWAGLDLSVGIFPLIRGNAYRFSRPIPLDPPDGDEADP